MSKDAPNATLLSVVWNWSAYYTYAVKNIVNGSWDCPNYFGGFKEGVVGITDLASFNDSKATAKINATIEKIKSGTLDIFTGSIPTNDGKTVGKPDTTFTDDDIQFSTTWLYKNIVVIK